MERNKENIFVVSYRIKFLKVYPHRSLGTPFGACSSRDGIHQMIITYIWVEKTCVQKFNSFGC